MPAAFSSTMPESAIRSRRVGRSSDHGTRNRLLSANSVKSWARFLARHLADLVERRPHLSLAATQVIDIVCFRYDPGGLSEPERKALNVEIMLRLQKPGIAALSDTSLNGVHCLRVTICNHRTRPEGRLRCHGALHISRDTRSASVTGAMWPALSAGPPVRQSLGQGRPIAPGHERIAESGTACGRRREPFRSCA